MLFLRKIFGQKPEIIKLAVLRQDNFLTVSSLDFTKSIKVVQKLIFRGTFHRTDDFFKGGENRVKKEIHPEYKETTITCACGEVIHTRSTKQNLRVEICSKCHPFFTGKQKLIDSARRIDKFRKKYGLSEK